MCPILDAFLDEQGMVLSIRGDRGRSVDHLVCVAGSGDGLGTRRTDLLM